MDGSERLVFEDVSVFYGRNPAILDVSFSFRHPFFVAVMGPNGAGKTTLLKAAIGLVKPSRGRILVFGVNPIEKPYEVRRKVGYASQIIHVDEIVPLRVWEVVLMGLLSKNPPPRLYAKKDREAVFRALGMVEMEDYAENLFSELSGGQKQRVMIARALVREPKLLLLDEPFSMLDYDIKCEIARLIHNLHSKLGLSVLIVAHELSPCVAYEPDVVLLNKRVYAIGKLHTVLVEENLKRAYPGLTKVKDMLIVGEDHG